MNITDTTLAYLVALPMTGPDRWGAGCVAWIDRQDRSCGQDRADEWLCKRHRTVATKRAERRLAEIKAGR